MILNYCLKKSKMLYLMILFQQHIIKNLKKFILADLFLLNKDITTNIIEKINYNINTDDRLLLDNDLVKLDDKIKIFSLDLIRYSDVSKFYEKNKDYNEIMNYIVNMYYPLLKKMIFLHFKITKNNLICYRKIMIKK